MKLKELIKPGTGINVSEMVLKAIKTRKKLVTYEVLNLNLEDPRSPGELIIPPDVFLDGTYTFYDPGVEDEFNRSVLIKNTSRIELGIDEDGNAVQKQSISPMHLIGGFLDVKPQEEAHGYVFMELHPLNESNKFRNNTLPAAFKRADKGGKSMNQRIADEDIRLYAEQKVVKMPFAQLKAVATKIKGEQGQLLFNVDDDVSPADLRYQVRLWVKTDFRAFLSVEADPKVMAMIKIKDARALKVLTLQERKWRMGEEGSNNKPFFTSELDVGSGSTENELINFFLSDEGSSTYDILCEIVRESE